ncbi:MAG: cytochrome c biogenesis CcdA family protein [Leptothrix sp. (in: b-proteobacteria)]
MSAWSDLALSVVAGSLTTLSPCVFPLLPLVLGGALQRHPAAPLLMGLGMAGSFALIGVLVGLLGDVLGLDPERVRVAGAWLLLGFGLVLLVPALNARFSLWMSPLANSANAASSRLDAGSRRGALLLGGLLGLVWTPCSGPLLGSTLALVASTGGAARGALLLGLFGLGAAAPLVAAAYASRSGFGRARGWLLQHGEQVRQLFGGLLLLAGLAVLSGADKWLETRLTDLLPDAWLRLTTRY